MHSYELLAALIGLAWMSDWPWLWGYVLGAALHLPLDIVFNGKLLSRNLVPFYSLAYRWRAGFLPGPLLGVTAPSPAPGGFWRSFFAELFPAPTAVGARRRALEVARPPSATAPSLAAVTAPLRSRRP